jgi:hypothetical protein
MEMSTIRVKAARQGFESVSIEGFPHDQLKAKVGIKSRHDKPFGAQIDLNIIQFLVLGIAGNHLEESGALLKVPQLSQYEEFVRKALAYRWLLTKIRQHGLLNFENPDVMLRIGTRIQDQFVQEALNIVGRQKPRCL